MKYLFAVLIVTFITAQSRAATACFAESSTAFSYQAMAFYAQPQAIQCSTKKQIGVGLDSFSWTLEAGSFYALCTGAGASVSVYLTGTALIANLVKMVVAEVNCVDNENEIKRDATLAICNTLNENLKPEAKKLDCSASQKE